MRDIIIQVLSTFSILTLGLMVGRSDNLWMLIPLLGMIIFYGLHMANVGMKKERMRQ